MVRARAPAPRRNGSTRTRFRNSSSASTLGDMDVTRGGWSRWQRVLQPLVANQWGDCGGIWRCGRTRPAWSREAAATRRKRRPWVRRAALSVAQVAPVKRRFCLPPASGSWLSSISWPFFMTNTIDLVLLMSAVGSLLSSTRSASLPVSTEPSGRPYPGTPRRCELRCAGYPRARSPPRPTVPARAAWPARCTDPFRMRRDAPGSVNLLDVLLRDRVHHLHPRGPGQTFPLVSRVSVLSSSRSAALREAT